MVARFCQMLKLKDRFCIRTRTIWGTTRSGPSNAFHQLMEKVVPPQCYFKRLENRTTYALCAHCLHSVHSQAWEHVDQNHRPAIPPQNWPEHIWLTARCSAFSSAFSSFFLSTWTVEQYQFDPNLSKRTCKWNAFRHFVFFVQMTPGLLPLNSFATKFGEGQVNALQTWSQVALSCKNKKGANGTVYHRLLSNEGI